MYLDICLRVWSFLAQTPLADTAAQGAVAEPAASATSDVPMSVVRYILMAVYLMVCVGLITVVLNQDTKTGGLSGMLGSGANSQSYHGKKSFEDNLKTAGNYLAVSFIVLSMVISLVMR